MRTLNKFTEAELQEQIMLQKKEIKYLKNELNRQKKRFLFWKQKYYSYKLSKQFTKVAHYSYPLEFIYLAIYMNIHFNISLRAVSLTIGLLGELFGLKGKTPSPVSIRNWSVKYGYLCLQKPLEKTDYVLISDESVEINQEKLLLTLAVPVSKISEEKPLTMQDVRVLDLGVQKSWTSQDLVKIIEKKRCLHELNILYAVSDKGHILKKAFKDTQIAWVEDCTHKVANIMQSNFSQNTVFQDFIQEINELRAKWICSKNNIYIPPSLRKKARFHQILTVYKWAKFIQYHWSKIPEDAQQSLHFVKNNTDFIDLLEAMHVLSNTFLTLFKTQSVQKKSIAEWHNFIEQYSKNKKLTQQALYFIKEVEVYLEQVSQTVVSDKPVLCCSDIIESTFGKYKNKGGAKIITEDVLKIAAYPHKITLQEMKIALQEVKTEQIYQWKKENIMTSKLAKLKKMRKNMAA